MNFKPLRVSVVLLGDRLATAVLIGSRVEAFVVEAETPAAALRAELDARGLPARNASLALARSAVTVKPIDLPPVTGDVRQMVGFELERHLPFQAEDASYDFVVLPNEAGTERPAGGEQRVLITAADRRIVDAALRLAEEARLRPMSLTVAAHNLPALARVPRGAHVAWVHRAVGATDLLMLVGDMLVLSRSLPGTDEALIADELRRSLVALRWRGCDAVWVSGDADAGHAPDANPLAELGAPITQPAWTARAARQIDELAEEQRGALELALAVASGRGARTLELLPSAVRPRRLTRPQAFTVGMAAATALLAIIALLAPGWREQRRLIRIDAEIARLDPDVKNVDRVLRDLERKRKLLATVDGVEASGVRPLPVLRELTEILPNDAWLTTVSLDAKGVELTGAASAASTLIPLLENSPRLERVEFSSPVTRGRDNREQFRIRAAWEASGAVAPPTTAPSAGPVGAAAPAPGAPASVAPVPAPGAPGVPAVPTPMPELPRRSTTPPAPGGVRQ
jgi:Tfp pilus assembly protein PilN